MEKCNDPRWAADQLTSKEAIAFHDSKVWEPWSDEQIVRFQLFQKCLAVPFDRLHKAVTVVLKRDVWTHEFAFHDRMVEEYLGERPVPSMQEIIDLLPEGKRRILILAK